MDKNSVMPKSGGKPTGMLSTGGKQKIDALGGGFDQGIVNSSKALNPVKPKKRDNRLK